MYVEIKSIDFKYNGQRLSISYAEGPGFVTQIQPKDNGKLKINGRDWLDCWGTHFSLESFHRVVSLLCIEADRDNFSLI